MKHRPYLRRIHLVTALLASILSTPLLVQPPKATGAAGTNGGHRPEPGGRQTPPHGQPAAGTVLTTVSVGFYPFAMAVNEHAGRLYVYDAENATVRLVDTLTGRVVRTVMVAPRPSGVGYNL